MTMTFDTPDGRGFLDATLLRLGDAKPGDVLVIRYSGNCPDGRAWAEGFRAALMDAAAAMPEGSIPLPVPAVVARGDLTWALEPVNGE